MTEVGRGGSLHGQPVSRTPTQRSFSPPSRPFPAPLKEREREKRGREIGTEGEIRDINRGGV